MALATRPKPKAHSRKRTAQHHRKTKHYVKTYWPYLPMLGIVGLGLTISSLWSQPEVLGIQRDFSSSTLLAASNVERINQHETSLTIDPQLSAAAQAKAQDMVNHDYWSHTSPSGKTAWSFIGEAGYQYQAAGENLAYGFTNADQVITGWMNSSEHRANVLGVNYRNVGFGVAQAPNFRGHGPQTIVVAEYGEPISAVANITFTVPTTTQNTPVNDVKGAQTELRARTVSRVQILTGGHASWSLIAVSAISGAALAIFISRHSRRLHRTLVHSEAFIIAHPFFDIVMTSLFMGGYVLSRTSGLVR